MSAGQKPLGPQNLVVVGQVRRPWGVKGSMTVDWVPGYVPAGESFPVYLRQGREGPLKKLKVIHSRRHGHAHIVGLEGVMTPEEAVAWRGSNIWIKRENLPALPKNEYYAYELVGMQVKSREGESLGEIENIFSTGSNDVYVVRKGADEILIPATHDVVKSIDREKKIMVIEVIEGLLEP